jgi:hypothetical protein
MSTEQPTPTKERHERRDTLKFFPEDYTPFAARNATNDRGRVAGGFAKGTGIDIVFQDGPLEEGEYPSGAFVEHVLEAAAQRLEFYQKVEDGRYDCAETALALEYVQNAIIQLVARKERRSVEGTLGTYGVRAIKVVAPQARYERAESVVVPPALLANPTPTMATPKTVEEWDDELRRRFELAFPFADPNNGVDGFDQDHAHCNKCGDWNFKNAARDGKSCMSAALCDGHSISTEDLAKLLGMDPRPEGKEQARVVPSEPTESTDS